MHTELHSNQYVFISRHPKYMWVIIKYVKTRFLLMVADLWRVNFISTSFFPCYVRSSYLVYFCFYFQT